MKFKFLAVALLACSLAYAAPQARWLLTAVTTTGAGTAVPMPTGDSKAIFIPTSAYQATVKCTGTCGATVNIEVTNDPNAGEWIVLATITLSGTTAATNGTTSNADWAYVRGNVTAISGTGAQVWLNMYP